MKRVLSVRLSDGFWAEAPEGRALVLGAKQQALLALLCTAPGGARTRVFLETTLWSRAQPEQAKASLRTALSTLRKNMGEAASDLLIADRETVILDLARVDVQGSESGSAFLAGFALSHEPRFADWLDSIRHRTVSPEHVQRTEQLQEPRLRRQEFAEVLPSIAVLPIINRNSQAALDPLGSILSEELTRLLARSQAFSVTSYLTMRQFDPRTTRACDVATACRVQYLLSGTVYVSGQNYRLTADLQEAGTGQVFWSRDFSGTIAELLSGQDEELRRLTQQIGRTASAEAVRLTRFRPLEDLDNHSLLMAAIALMQDPQPGCFDNAHELFLLLLQREPDHVLVLTWLGFWHVMRAETGMSQDAAADRSEALSLADKALERDAGFSLAWTLKGLAGSHLSGAYDAAIVAYDQALMDNPNETLALLLKGTIRALQGKTEEALALTTQAWTLSPLDPQAFFFDSLSATVQLAAQDFDQAISLVDRSMSRHGVQPTQLQTKAIALELSGRRDEARRVVGDLMRVKPGFTVEQYLRETHAANAKTGQRWAQALNAAGVPE